MIVMRTLEEDNTFAQVQLTSHELILQERHLIWPPN